MSKLAYKVTLNVKQVLALAILLESGDGVSSKNLNFLLNSMALFEYNRNPENELTPKLREKYEAWIKLTKEDTP